MAFQNLFGDVVIDNAGNKLSTADLSKNVAVGIYFSAHWCPPCRGFTPQLAKSYNKLKEKGFEIVFVSSDRDEKSFNDYHKEMPWLALPYELRDTKAALSKKFKVNGIPSLIILDNQGKIINGDGRTAVSEDPEGAEFPWKPKSFADIIGDKFVDTTGAAHTYESMKDKVIGLYFSAHWCGPCRAFTPQLTKTYNTLKAQNKPFEIIFVSSDRDETSFTEYHSSMPWLAVPYEDRARAAALSSLCEVQGIPSFVLVDGATGKFINKAGRGIVSEDPEGHNFPWTPKPVNELNGSSASSLNETAAVILFAEKEDPAAAVQAMTAVAKKAEGKGDEEESNDLTFLYAKEHPIVARVKQLMSYQAGAPVVAILDIPQESVFYSKIMSIGDVTTEAVQQFVSDYRAGLLDKLPISA